MPLYHKDVGLPAFRLPMAPVQLSLTLHAECAQHNDRYGNFVVPDVFALRANEVIELETSSIGGAVTKIVVRCQYNSRFDIVMALRPIQYANHWRVTTAWLNERSDVHSTLRKQIYTKGS